MDMVERNDRQVPSGRGEEADLEGEENRKPAEHVVGVGGRVDAQVYVPVQLRVEVPGEPMAYSRWAPCSE